MKRALKRWWVYLAAVPLADGKSAFRIGRSLDMLATVRKLREDSPLPVAKVWALPTLSERSAFAAVNKVRCALATYHHHESWMHIPTATESAKSTMQDAMNRALPYASVDQDSPTPRWISVDLRNKGATVHPLP